MRPGIKTTEVKEVKLDQTTARVVTELAGQLMPPLVNALDKSIKNSAKPFVNDLLSYAVKSVSRCDTVTL